MDNITFEKLQLKLGELIVIEKIGGQQFSGTYENEYDNSKGEFKFSNYSNGKIENISIDKLFNLKRLK